MKTYHEYADEGMGDYERGINALKRFTSRVARMLRDSATAVGLCFLDLKGRVMYANSFFSKIVMKSVSSYVKEKSSSIPVGSYVIPDESVPVILWKISDSAILAAQSKGTVAPLITKTPLILRLARKVEKILNTLSSISLEGEYIPFSDKLDVQPWDVFSLKQELPEGLREDELRVLNEIDGNRSVLIISELTGIPIEKCVNILRRFLALEIVKKVELCPIIKRVNAGKLLLFGLSEKYVRLYRELKFLCDGTRSVREVADALGLRYERLRYLLSILGDDVIWVKRES
ncbi:MAG: hypothetical protein ACTSWP_00110 [Candidatus Freyarchaeota archaeon]|nr:hypothetical protein [Candidatus Freyrarchaeum guaymaensis]